MGILFKVSLMFYPSTTNSSVNCKDNLLNFYIILFINCLKRMFPPKVKGMADHHTEEAKVSLTNYKYYNIQ